MSVTCACEVRTGCDCMFSAEIPSTHLNSKSAQKNQNTTEILAQVSVSRLSCQTECRIFLDCYIEKRVTFFGPFTDLLNNGLFG